MSDSDIGEFLTHQTTCASEMVEKTPCEIFCQTGPAVGGGTLGPGDTWHVPPGPLPAGPCRRWQLACVAACRHTHWRQAACRHPHWRQVAGQGPCRQGRGHAATPTGGRAGAMPPPPLAAGGRAGARSWATSPGRTEADVPAMPTAARPAGTGPGGTCNVSPGPGVPPPTAGLF
jgi:hypothetical protein